MDAVVFKKGSDWWVLLVPVGSGHNTGTDDSASDVAGPFDDEYDATMMASRAVFGVGGVRNSTQKPHSELDHDNSSVPQNRESNIWLTAGPLVAA